MRSPRATPPQTPQPALLVTPLPDGVTSPQGLAASRRASPPPDALPSGRQPCRGSARLPGPLGDLGAHLPATCLFSDPSAPQDLLGAAPSLGLPQPIPNVPPYQCFPHLPLTGVSTGSDQTVLGVTSEGPGTQPSRVRSTHIGPEPRPASCPQHRHAENPQKSPPTQVWKPRPPATLRPKAPRARPAYYQKGHGQEVHEPVPSPGWPSPTPAPQAVGTGQKPLLCFWEQVSGPLHTQSAN